MRKLILIFCVGICVSQSLAQESSSKEPDIKFIDRCYVGGDIGLQFNTNYSFFSLAPFAGYYLAPNLSAGVGLRYQWTSFRQYSAIGTDTTIHRHMVGGSVFARYEIADQFLLHAEYEIVNRKVYDPFDNREYRRNVPIAMAGAGIKYPMGPQSYAQFLILYDFIDDRDSPYPNYFQNAPIIFRGGFVFQLGNGMPDN